MKYEVLEQYIQFLLTWSVPEKTMYESAAQRPTTTILLRNMRKLTTPVSTASRAQLRSSRKKASCIGTVRGGQDH